MLQGVLNILGKDIVPLNILAKKYLYPVCFEASGYQYININININIKKIYIYIYA